MSSGRSFWIGSSRRNCAPPKDYTSRTGTDCKQSLTAGYRSSLPLKRSAKACLQPPAGDQRRQASPVCAAGGVVPARRCVPAYHLQSRLGADTGIAPEAKSQTGATQYALPPVRWFAHLQRMQSALCGHQPLLERQLPCGIHLQILYALRKGYLLLPPHP